MSKCAHCPLAAEPETACVAEATDHRRFCAHADPGSPTHAPARLEAIRRLTLEPLGRWSPPPAPAVAPVPRARPAPASFPPLTRQAANLAGAVGRFAASGGAMATAEEKARRLEICGGCDQFREGRCLRCGCRLRYKVMMKSEHCPLDPPKW